MAHEPRFYRDWLSQTGLVPFQVLVKETDLLICADKNLQSKGEKYVKKYRQQLEKVIKDNDGFQTSLRPLALPNTNLPPIALEMVEKTTVTGVGPMAAVAGAIAQYVGNDLLKHSDEIIIENGGDIFLKTHKKRTIGIYSGEKSPFSNKVGIEILPENTPMGICTSSGTVGHSLSFGKSDAVIVLASSTILADAAATALANLVQDKEEIEEVIARGKTLVGLSGIIVIKDEKIGIWGRVKLAKL